MDWDGPGETVRLEPTSWPGPLKMHIHKTDIR